MFSNPYWQFLKVPQQSLRIELLNPVCKVLAFHMGLRAFQKGRAFGSAWVHSGCPATDQVAYKQQHSGGGKAQDQGISRCSAGRDASRLQHGTPSSILTQWKQQGSSRRPPLEGHQPQPQTEYSPSHTITLGIKFQHMNFAGAFCFPVLSFLLTLRY